MCIYHILIQSSVDGHLGCFHVLAIVNNAAMNIGAHVYIFYNDFYFFHIAGLQCSVNFLLYSLVIQLHIHVYILFSHIIRLHHK